MSKYSEMSQSDPETSERVRTFYGGISPDEVRNDLRGAFGNYEFNWVEIQDMMMWKAGKGWITAHGPRPGERGCRVDPRLLRFFEAPSPPEPNKKYSVMTPAEKASVDASFDEIKRNVAKMDERTAVIKTAEPLPPLAVGANEMRRSYQAVQAATKADSTQQDRQHGGRALAGETLAGVPLHGDKSKANANQRASEAV